MAVTSRGLTAHLCLQLMLLYNWGSYVRHMKQSQHWQKTHPSSGKMLVSMTTSSGTHHCTGDAVMCSPPPPMKHINSFCCLISCFFLFAVWTQGHFQAGEINQLQAGNSRWHHTAGTSDWPGPFFKGRQLVDRSTGKWGCFPDGAEDTDCVCVCVCCHAQSHGGNRNTHTNK